MVDPCNLDKGDDFARLAATSARTRNGAAGDLWAFFFSFFIGYFIFIAVATALETAWLNVMIQVCDPLVDLVGRLFPIFDSIQHNLPGQNFVHRVAIVRHVIAVGWLANVLLAVCLLIWQISSYFDESICPLFRLRPASSRKAAYGALVGFMLLTAGVIAIYAFGWSLPTNDPRFAFQASSVSLFFLGFFSLTISYSAVGLVSIVIDIAQRERAGWHSS
jgi:hypothetical protein